MQDMIRHLNPRHLLMQCKREYSWNIGGRNPKVPLGVEEAAAEDGAEMGTHP